MVVIIDRSENGDTKYTWVAIKSGDEWRVVSETISRVSKPQ